MNVNIQTGELSFEPKIFTSAQGKKYATFALKVYNGTNKDGKAFYSYPNKYKVFGALCQKLEGLGKGTQLEVRSHIVTGSYQKDNGETIWNEEYHVDEIIVLAQVQSGAQQPQPQQPKQQPKTYDPQQQYAQNDDFIVDEEDLPF